MNGLLDFYKGKKVFLTGHTGFKGTWLSRILILAGAEVTGYSLEPPTSPSLFEQTKTASQINSITGDKLSECFSKNCRFSKITIVL